MTQTQTIEAIKAADITQDGWLEEIVSKIESRYTAGYLSAKIGQFNESLSTSSEDFREEILTVCAWDIWKA